MSKSQLVINRTKNYQMFEYQGGNRDVELNGTRRKLLKKSLEEFGWLEYMPMIVKKTSGKLFITEGQHRFALASELKIEVPYVIENDIRIDPVLISGTGVPWNLKNFVASHAAKQNKDFVELLDFTNDNEIPLAIAIAILGNNATERNHLDAIKRGTWKISSRKLANDVMNVYRELNSLNNDIGVRSVVGALYAIWHCKGLDMNRFAQQARRYPRMLHKVSNRDDALLMLEDLYNFGKHQKDPIKIMAENALRQRSATYAAKSRKITEEKAA